jgi:hypothetical protein
MAGDRIFSETHSSLWKETGAFHTVPYYLMKKYSILRRKKMKKPHEKNRYYPAFLTYYPVKSGKQGNRGNLRAPSGGTPE